jgi:hypothetical protein
MTPDDYYVAGANALEDIVGFYRVVKGQDEQLASLRRCRLAAGLSQTSANVKVSANAWHTLATVSLSPLLASR